VTQSGDWEGKMPHKKSRALVLAPKLANLQMSEGVKSLITRMTGPEADRPTINQVLADPWLAREQNTEALPDTVLEGLLTLAQDKTVNGAAGDYFVQEVGTEGTHIIERAKIPTAYDVENPIVIANLTEKEKLSMPKWEVAQQEAMVLYRAKKERTMVVVNASTIEALKANWPALRCSVANGDCVVENAESMPSNDEVYGFVHAKVEAKDPNFQVQTYRKLGVFAREMTQSSRKGLVLKHTESVLIDGPAIFAYRSGRDAELAHEYLKIVPGDAFVYRPDKGRVHTMEKAAVEMNFRVV